jgi:hypothetical protein
MAKKKAPRKPPAPHPILAIGGAVLIAALLLTNIKKPEAPLQPLALIMTVEHHGRQTLSVNAAKNSKPGIVELRKDGSGTLMVKLPEQMVLREVRGAALAAVQKSNASKGMRTWTLPSAATLSFILEPRSPSSFIIRSQSSDPLLLKLKTINVASGSVLHDSMLLGKGEVTMW